MVLLATTVSLVVMPVGAQQAGIPGDVDGDDNLTEAELASAIISYMLGEGKYSLDDVGDAAWVYAHWNGEPKTITDSVGSEVTIYKPIERVVIAYWIDAALTLQSLKAEDTVVGVIDAVKYEPILLPELSKLPSVGLMPDPGALDFEKILALEPDVVFTGGSSANPTAYEEIARRIHSVDPDIAVLVFTFCHPSLYVEEAKKMGYLFDREKEAEELVDFIEEHLNPIKEGVKDISEENRTKVYTEYFMDYLTFGNDPFGAADSVRIAGGKNIFDDLPPIAWVGPEDVISRTPEVIIHHPGGAYFGKVGYATDDVSALRDKRNEIMNRPGFAAVPAVKNGSVYTCYSFPTSAMYFVGIAYYAKWFYPEEFGDLYPNTIHQEYLDRFMRIDFDLDEHGVFVYHPEQHPDGR